jgi:hypothetical protein
MVAGHRCVLGLAANVTDNIEHVASEEMRSESAVPKYGRQH